MRCLNLRDRRGVVIVIVAIALVVLLGMAALAIDLGQLYVARQKAQNACDAAVLAGVWPLTSTNPADTVDVKKQRAMEIAQQTATGNNEVTTWRILKPGEEAEGVEVTFPTGNLKDIGDDDILDENGNVRSFADGEAIKARGEVLVTFGFARIFGFGTKRVAAEATAIIEMSKGFCSDLMVPLAVSDAQILGVDGNTPIEFGAQYPLKVTNWQSDFLGAGNFGALTFEGDDPGARDYYSRLAGNSPET